MCWRDQPASLPNRINEQEEGASLEAKDTTYTSAPTQFVRRPLTLQGTYDLLLFAGLALCCPVLLLLPLPLLRVPLGLLLALIAPGYALQAAIFSKRSDLDAAARAALSFGLSVATIPALALVLNALPWGIRPWPIAISLSIWILLLCGIALVRRAWSPPGQTFMPPAIEISAWWRNIGRHDQRHYVIGVLAFALIVMGGAAALFAPDPSAHPTEFYMLGTEGQAQDYPREAVLGQALSVTVGIADHERAERTYHVEVWAVYPWGAGRRMLVAQAGPITLQPGQQREWPMTWRMPWAGEDQKVEILLFTADSQKPYRTLYMWLNVVEQSQTR